MYVEYYARLNDMQEMVEYLPDVKATIHDVVQTGPNSLRLVCSFYGKKIDQVSNGLDQIEIIDKVSILDQSKDTIVSKLEMGTETEIAHIFQEAIESDGYHIKTKSTTPDWYSNWEFPGRNEFREFSTSIEDRGLNIQPTIIRDQRSLFLEGNIDLTEKQKELLIQAVKHGYFEVPRNCSLADIAESIDISQQAASERLRRGLRTLVDREVIYDMKGYNTSRQRTR